jgi:hypothetical protein
VLTPAEKPEENLLILSYPSQASNLKAGFFRTKPHFTMCHNTRKIMWGVNLLVILKLFTFIAWSSFSLQHTFTMMKLSMHEIVRMMTSVTLQLRWSKQCLLLFTKKKVQVSWRRRVRILEFCSCRLISYCSVSCQATHWKTEPFGHKVWCVAPADRKPSTFQPEKAKSDTHLSQDLCGVCFEPLLADNVLRSGAPHAGTQTLVCNHSFHLKCASEWESLSQSSLCPL